MNNRESSEVNIMATNFKLVMVSGNKKTGPIPVSTTSKNSCPSTCPLLGNGCYAALGHTNIHWSRLSDKGQSESEFLAAVRKIRKGQLWRHNQAGDLPHNDGHVDGAFLRGLVAANKGKHGFTYTHHLPEVGDNASLIKEANDGGFAVNLSANNLDQAVEYRESYDSPVVTVMAMDAPNVQEYKGHRVVACPAEKSDKVNCSTCGLCQKADRDYIIGFRAHGIQKKRVELIAKGG